MSASVTKNLKKDLLILENLQFYFSPTSSECVQHKGTMEVDKFCNTVIIVWLADRIGCNRIKMGYAPL